MANVTTQVAASKPREVLRLIERAKLAAAAAKMPQGGLIGRASGGYYQKADDTAALIELGVQVSPSITPDSADSDGATYVEKETGIVVPLKIATLTSDAKARSHYGCPVYALYNDEVQLNRGSYGNFVGWIVGHNSVTEVLVYIPPAGVQNQGRAIGTIYNNQQPWYQADEWEEIHAKSMTAGGSKAFIRYIVSNGVVHTGEIRCMEIIAQSGYDAAWAGVNCATLYGASIEAIIKGGATVSTLVCAARFKTEDNRATGEQSAAGPTITGKVVTVQIQSQISADPTGKHYAVELNCMADGSGTGNQGWDALFYVPTGGANDVLANIFEFGAAATAVVVGAGTYSTADGYLLIKVGASTYRIPFFTGVD